MDPPLQFQGESNHHANVEMIDKAGVPVVEKGSIPENLADSGRTFHSLADGRGSDVDVILIGGLRLANPPYRATESGSLQ